ncbi:phosphotransferase [Amycolatopsis circi]|uniref:phosphotransferase n=1 Tax=Amycolatopsis circi TaxID=871959 RepID=UPI001FC9B4C6|nr:phosphotransferase [Amycolatopsis circi]
MSSQAWEEIPATVRRAVEKETGKVSCSVSPSDGRNSDFLATLQAERGCFFVKGVLAGSRRERMQQIEAKANPVLPRSVAPRLLWEAEAGGWSLLGFEQVAGQHANFEPGSPDLPLVADAAVTMARELARCSLDLPSAAEQWAWASPWRRLSKQADSDLDQWDRRHLDELVEWERQGIDWVRGDSLVHGDLHPLNILVADRARVVDWAWSSLGAPWLDAASLVLRLVADGHTPAQAEEWARRIPVYRDAPDQGITAFSVLVLGMWTYRGAFPRLTEVARRYVRHRLAR